MRAITPLMLFIAGACLTGAARAQLLMPPDDSSRAVFGGSPQNIRVIFQNPGASTVSVKLRTKLFQASSSTVVPVGEAVEWKELQVLPGQTIIESNLMTFPLVRAATRFLVHWVNDKEEVLGRTDLMVYPTNLLAPLKTLTGKDAIGVFDPGNQLKPLLKMEAVEFEDFELQSLDSFSGKLAVIGPFQSKAQMPEGLARRIDTLVKKNVAVVWIQPPREEPLFAFIPKKLQPSYYLVQRAEGHTAVAVVQPELVADLPENPRSQLSLVYFCGLALNPKMPALPGLSPEH